jgi:hypothetical protein
MKRAAINVRVSTNLSTRDSARSEQNRMFRRCLCARWPSSAAGPFSVGTRTA